MALPAHTRILLLFFLFLFAVFLLSTAIHSQRFSTQSRSFDHLQEPVMEKELEPHS
ncbi:hypothetical protein [Ectobacillus ponti]|uniref:Uncharacterized protein n=1 Tax=Ectobacillus ponti TaxID=2961894 RepID=A0AA41X4L5_9BACI|nr:hypothetical protein [Ectobacillus ponti]MCP8967083.1 hypothetical protein [Ectobacillus ponti]